LPPRPQESPANPVSSVHASATKGERTAQRILDVAEALFAEHGYAGTSLRDVARAAGLRTPSLYNHFESKESLYGAVLDRGLAPVLRSLAESLSSAGPPDDEAAAALVERTMQLLAERPNLPRLVHYEALAGGEQLSPILRKWLQPAFEHAHAMVDRSPSAERWSAEQRPLLALAMVNILLGYFSLAPLHRELSGQDLLAADVIAVQTDLFRQIASTLFLQPSKPDDAGN